MKMDPESHGTNMANYIHLVNTCSVDVVNTSNWFDDLNTLDQ